MRKRFHPVLLPFPPPAPLRAMPWIRPFPNLLQLLSVLPPQSAQFLPKPYADLMVDPLSPLAEYYPKDFEVDAVIFTG